MSMYILFYCVCNILVQVKFPVYVCDTYRLDNETDVDTICVTVEDYYQDFLHLRVTHCHRLMQMIHEQIIVSYLRQLLSPSR